MKGTWSELSNLGEIKAAGFDTVLSFNWGEHHRARQAETLASARECSIGYIPYLGHLLKHQSLEAAKAVVKRFMNHEAIAGWLTYDEPQLRRIHVSTQLDFYEDIKSVDPAHPLYTAYMADAMDPRYYDPKTCDRKILTYYPFRSHGYWKDYFDDHLDGWIESTGNKDVYPNMQGHQSPRDGGDLVSPRGMMEEQYQAWVSKGMTGNGYLIYAWQDGDRPGSRGISEIPGMLEEVKELLKGTNGEDDEPDDELNELHAKVAEMEIRMNGLEMAYVAGRKTWNELKNILRR